MANKLTSIITLMLIALGMLSCENKKPFDNVAEITAFLIEDDNGLSKSKEANGYKITLTYLPSEFLAFKDVQETQYNSLLFDSIVNSYQGGLYFLMDISPDEKSRTGDVMLQDVYSREEYKSRFVNLTFNAEAMITLACPGDEVSYFPVLTSIEHSYGLSDNRQMLIAFEKIESITNCSSITIEFDDNEFETGINKFSFSWNELKAFPKERVKTESLS